MIDDFNFWNPNAFDCRGKLVFLHKGAKPPPVAAAPAARGEPAQTVETSVERDPLRRKQRGYSSTMGSSLLGQGPSTTGSENKSLLGG